MWRVWVRRERCIADIYIYIYIYIYIRADIYIYIYQLFVLVKEPKWSTRQFYRTVNVVDPGIYKNPVLLHLFYSRECILISFYTRKLSKRYLQLPVFDCTVNTRLLHYKNSQLMHVVQIIAVCCAGHMYCGESRIILLHRVVQAGNYRCFLDGYLQ